MRSKPILVTGATGYVGGRLIPRLLEAGYRVRAMGRSIAKLKSRPWGTHPNIELTEGDVLEFESLRKSVSGCRAAYYLVHSMNPLQKDFAAADRKGAQNMALSAAEAGLEKIIYLGGLGNEQDPNLSEHLKSRLEVAKILQSGKIPTTFLRAAMILGSGSASFEILRYLMDRLPVMFTPRWVNTPCQPISIRNVLKYLENCLESNETIGQTFDIGGPDVLTYKALMQIYAEEAKLPRRWIIPVSFMTPRLSAYWIHLISPVPASIAIPLAEGLSVPVVCKDNRIQSIIPQRLLSCRETIRLALERIQQEQVETRWSDAGVLNIPEWTYCGDAAYAGGTILECGYYVRLRANAMEVWEPISKIGGHTGWYFGNFLWKIRGGLDRLIGGIGLRRGRRHPAKLFVGDALDFWRVLDVEPPNHLLLLAEMKNPGEALLEFRITTIENGEIELQQLSRFLPKGLGGILYWYAIYPIHQWLFGGMLRKIAESIGKPISYGPKRFTPKLNKSCDIRSNQL
ncbi:MAG: SDR family oxidoreductase [Desulfobacterales bacterium]|nr:SDR family oxidoreductase [Desulfobacterales bacterium]